MRGYKLSLYGTAGFPTTVKKVYTGFTPDEFAPTEFAPMNSS